MTMPDRAEDVPSPCVKICQLDAAGVCVGCGRRIEEIAEWAAASARRKQQIVTAAARRRAEPQSGESGK